MTDLSSAIPMVHISPTANSPSGISGAIEKGGGFSAALNSAVDSALSIGQKAESESMKAITDGGNVTEVVTALSQAELTLQTVTAIRDRMLQAYQDVMRIPI